MTMKVIQTDGYPVVPMQANSVILGWASGRTGSSP